MSLAAFEEQKHQEGYLPFHLVGLFVRLFVLRQTRTSFQGMSTIFFAGTLFCVNPSVTILSLQMAQYSERDKIPPSSSSSLHPSQNKLGQHAPSCTISQTQEVSEGLLEGSVGDKLQKLLYALSKLKHRYKLTP